MLYFTQLAVWQKHCDDFRPISVGELEEPSCLSAIMARLAVVLGCAVLLFAPTSHAFAPSGMAGLRLKSGAAVSRRAAATSPKMSLDAVEGAAQLLAAAQNVPFVDEVTGDPQGFTAPVNHFASVRPKSFCHPQRRSCASLFCCVTMMT